MDWLTEEEALVAAKAGPEAALKCSQKHWWQLFTATRKEILAHPDKENLTRNTYCAMCIRSGSGCADCPLSLVGMNCIKGDGPWCDADLALYAAILGGTTRNARNTWRRWKRWSKRMYEAVMSLKPGK